MGKLFDVFSKKKKNVDVDMPQEQVKIAKYNRTWLSRVALYQGYSINDDNKKVDGILSALNRRDGQCPCGGNGAQYKCPCIIMRTKGICKCGLFKTIEDRKVTGTSTGASTKTDKETE